MNEAWLSLGNIGIFFTVEDDDGFIIHTGIVPWEVFSKSTIMTSSTRKDNRPKYARLLRKLANELENIDD